MWRERQRVRARVSAEEEEEEEEEIGLPRIKRAGGQNPKEGMVV